MKAELKRLFIIMMLLTTAPTLPFFKKVSREEKFLNAAEQGQIRVLRRAIKAGVDVNTRNQLGKTALMLAAANGHKRIVELLLDNPVVDVNLQDTTGKTSLILALLFSHPIIAELLIKNPAIDVNLQGTDLPDKKQWTALMLAAVKGYTNIVRLLIEHGADVNQETYLGQTALIYAVKFNKPTIVKLLLENGADINVQDSGKPILDYAKSRNFNEILKVIKDFVESHQKLLIEEGLPKDLAELTVEFETGLKKK